MTLSLQQLRTAATRKQVLTDLLELLDTIDFPATSWHEGAVGETLAQIGAEVWSKLSEHVAFMVDMAFNETAIGEALTRLAKSHYDNTRQPAIETQIRAVLTCAPAEGPHNIDIDDVVITDDDGHIFRNVAGLGVVYPATLTSGGTLALLFEAETAGSEYNVSNDTVTTMVTTLAGVTVTNAGAAGSTNSIVRLGEDEESDPAIQLRNSTKWATLSVESIRETTINVALNAAVGIAKADVDDQNPNGAGTFDVYVAGEANTAGGTDVTDALTALEARFFGSGRVRVFAAPERPLDLAGTVYYDANFSETDVTSAVEAALLEFIKLVPLGGYDLTPLDDHIVPKNDIENAIKETLINGAKCVKTVTLATPATDVLLSTFDILTVGTYTLTYTAVTGTG
jgi:hypothetical protein